MHCFSGSLEFAKECIKEGIYISLGGVVTFKNAKTAKEVAANIPLEYLLLETDDPYLTPVPFRGKENQPSYVKYVAEEIAKLRNISANEVAAITTKNALNIFKKIEPN
jgi:TatD DNase family protein